MAQGRFTIRDLAVLPEEMQEEARYLLEKKLKAERDVDPSSWEIDFPFTFPSVNRWPRSWQSLYGVAKEYREEYISYFDLEERLPLFTTPVIVEVKLQFTTKRKRDPSNYVPKWLVDALVEKMIIPDDSEEWCLVMPSLLAVGDEPKTVVRITPQEESSAPSDE